MQNDNPKSIKEIQQEEKPHLCSQCKKQVEPQEYGKMKVYPSHCPGCAEIIEQERQQRESAAALLEAEICLAESQKKIQACIAEQIPSLFQTATLELLPKALLEKVMALPSDRGLYFYGPIGCGKTFSLCAIARHSIESGRDVIRKNWESFLSELKAGFGDGFKTDKIIERMKVCDLLILDDISIAGRESDFSLRTLYDILNSRIENCKPTYFSSNRTPEEIGKAYDERILSRIRGACECIKIVGHDRRREKKIKNESITK
jgi:DNA replication protein DnaC